MSKTDADILRDVARLVMTRGLDGRTFPAAVDATRDRHRRDAPEPVRRLAALIRWRRPEATPADVAAMLTAEAELAEAAASPA